MNLKKNKISFCTVCMNRVHHLMKTLPANIADNENYSNTEFIILDYNSSDETERFVKKQCAEFIKSGKVIYYKTFSPNDFNRSHSRNLAFKLATGDILCNIDADNFTGKNFAFYINTFFNREKEILLTTIGDRSISRKKDVLGRICLKREDFYKVGGFDESFICYGYEDFDFANRLELSGLKRRIISKKKHLSAISHTESERISDEFFTKELSTLLIGHINPTNSVILFLLRNGELKKYTLIDNNSFERFCSNIVLPVEMELGFRVSENATNWKWEAVNSTLYMSNQEDVETLTFNAEKNYYVSNFTTSCLYYFKVLDKEFIERTIMFISLLINAEVMRDNKEKGRVRVNTEGFGRDCVYKNFDLKNPIWIN